MFDGVICLLAQKWAKMSENVVLHNDRLLNSLSGVNKSGISCIPLIRMSFSSDCVRQRSGNLFDGFRGKELERDFIES